MKQMPDDPLCAEEIAARMPLPRRDGDRKKRSDFSDKERSSALAELWQSIVDCTYASYEPERPIEVIRIAGNYGQAGLMILVNGSPPRAMMLLLTDQLDSRTLFVWRKHLGERPTAIPTDVDHRPAKERLLRKRVLHYLKTHGWLENKFSVCWGYCPECSFPLQLFTSRAPGNEAEVFVGIMCENCEKEKTDGLTAY